MILDSAVVSVLGLDPQAVQVESHGGSGFSATAKITSKAKDGSETYYFLKIGKGKDKEVMFAGEHASLNAIHDLVPSLCPKSFAHGELQNSTGSYFLVTDFLDLSGRLLSTASAKGGSGMRLAQKLAKLHTTAAPVPDGFDAPVFGFPATTCCGDSPQPNGFRTSWAAFYAENRLRAIVQRSEHTNGKDPALGAMVEKVAGRVVPRLLGDDHLNGGRGVKPVVVHGDLWSGNAGRGRIGGRGAAEDVVYDPSSVYGHNEYELGIMKMFGGFGDKFLDEYHGLCPKAEPVEEYDDRISLYELYVAFVPSSVAALTEYRYHHLNHHAIFGGYRSGAVSIMKKLIKVYGQTP
jgi:fructosamine-3-kinase